jgi:probable F420-dependent oxidoreductase
VLRDYAQAAEASGYSRLVLGEHVLGADPDRPGGWDGLYTHEDQWPEPLTTLSYLSALTDRIELMTGVLILPQRQTALVAKQAAQLDVISGGRLVLGVGTGWNAVEYEGLGQDFHTRGRRMEEQIRLLRLLWAEPVVSFEGEWDRVELAGINPLPMRRDIPIWVGGNAAKALDRAGRVADGWFPLGVDASSIQAGLERMRSAARDAGRDPDPLGLQCCVMETGDRDGQVEEAQRFDALGATYVGLITSRAELSSPQQHIDALTRFAEAVRSA